MRTTIHNAAQGDSDYIPQIILTVEAQANMQLGSEHSFVFQPTKILRFVVWKEADATTPEGYNIICTAQHQSGCVGCGRGVWS